MPLNSNFGISYFETETVFRGNAVKKRSIGRIGTIMNMIVDTMNKIIKLKHFIYLFIRARDRQSVSLLPQCPTSGHVYTVPSSPGWHRRERRRRSEARARLRASAATGTAYKKVYKDLDLLENHHSKPAYVKVRKLLSPVMGEWLSSKQWWGGRGSGYYSSGYYTGKGTGKGTFADKEQTARKERQKDKKKGGQKGLPQNSGPEQEDKAPGQNVTELGPSYAEMLKQSRMPEAKKQHAASALEEVLASAIGEDREQLLHHLRALAPGTGAASSASGTSLKTRIHRVGNALGKASAKVAKQTEEIDLKQKTWDKCSHAIREWASKQKKAFEKDLAEAKELLATAQKEEKEAMAQLQELQAQLQAQGPTEETPMEEQMEEEALFETPPTLQEKDTGMTPLMKRLSLQLQAATNENEELKRQNKLMMEETQKLFSQMQQNEKQELKNKGANGEVAATAEEVQKKLDQDRLRRQKQLERARSVVAQDKVREDLAKDRERERSQGRQIRKDLLPPFQR